MKPCKRPRIPVDLAAFLDAEEAAVNVSGDRVVQALITQWETYAAGTGPRPTIVALAAVFNCSPSTVRNRLQKLAANGRVRVIGRGGCARRYIPVLGKEA